MGNYGIVEDNIDFVKKRVDEGISAYRIAKELGCSKPSVLSAIHKHGLKLKTKAKQDPDNLLKDKLDQVIKLYNEGHSVNEVGKIVGHNGGHVADLLRKNSIEIRDFRYGLDETFFEKIDCEENAYALGWFYSDGNVSVEKGALRIQIQAEDREILEILSTCMKYTGPIHDIPPPKKFPHRKPQVLLHIVRRKLVDQLVTLGCKPAKSLILTFPEEDVVSDSVLHHFVRGCWDGDGGWCTRNNKYKNTYITSTHEFVCGLRERVLDPMGIRYKIYQRHEGRNSYTLHINYQADVKMFQAWLYKDAKLYLKRKYNESNSSGN